MMLKAMHAGFFLCQYNLSLILLFSVLENDFSQQHVATIAKACTQCFLQN